MARKSARGAAFLTVAALLGAATAVPAANLLSNGTFDADVSGWSVTSPDAQIVWYPDDADGSPNSGAMGLANFAVVTPPTTLVGLPAVQCVPVQPGVRHVLVASAMIPLTSQGLPGGAQLRLQFSPNPDCTFQNAPPAPLIAALEDTTVGSWGTILVGGWSPEEAKSAHVAVITMKGPTGDGQPFIALFDNASLLPLPFAARFPMLASGAD